MQFYNVKTRTKVEVPDNEVELVTMANGRRAGKAQANGVGLYKILSKDDIARLGK